MKIILPALFLTVGIALAATAHQKTAPAPEAAPESAPEAPTGAMTVDQLDLFIRRIDPEATRDGNAWQFILAERQVYVVTDPASDRMRIMTPIIQKAALTPALYERMMQANFDSALDARYAVAQDILWSIFLHPLGALSEREFLSGTAQTVTAAINFGTSFSSGVIVYGGGDSSGIIERQLLDELLKREGTPL